eukprot:TRINITY_DN34789_c0_g1_i1.p1 TRINITY_DN34789_c0_g1~~TRINITY_DN34789_c0_g1_i1.p1  ORF type:complete len:340 (+),score=50.83 TRINITY_DN34789_c0_g1_i1:40-1059(+)
MVVPETVQHLAKRLSQVSELLLRDGDDSSEWRTVLAQTDEFLSPPIAKVLDVLSRYEPGASDAHTFDPYGTGYQARLVRAKNAFLAACEGESPQIRPSSCHRPPGGMSSPAPASSLLTTATRYESPAQVRPMSPILTRNMSPGPVYSHAPNVASIPPPRMVSGSGAGAVIPPVPVAALPGSGTPTSAPPPVQYFRSLVSPLVKKRSMSPPRDAKPAVPSPVLPVSPAPLLADYPTRISSTSNIPSVMEPVITAPAPRTAGVSPVPLVPAQGVDVLPILADSSLQQYASDFVSNNITTGTQFYKLTGRDLQCMNLPTEVQTTILTQIRDYWIEKASAHRP